LPSILINQSLPLVFKGRQEGFIVYIFVEGCGSVKINKIHHVAVICSDYEKSKDFYVRILGLTPVNEVYREERGSYKLDLEVGGQYQISGGDGFL
jgi:hypothetical protein